MSKIQQEIRRLNRRLLSTFEVEFDVLKDENPELKAPIDSMFKRIRKNTLDVVGDCERSVAELEGTTDATGDTVQSKHSTD